MQLKVCGITGAQEIVLLNQLGLDFVGIWHGVNDGHADLPFDRFQHLAHKAVATKSLKPVLVTLLRDHGRLQDSIARSGVRWVQLHGFQPPSLVLSLKRAFGDPVGIIKVLHIQGRRCVEQPLIGAYERAGVDLFLLDALTSDGRIGSTGQRLDGDAVIDLADRMTRPFLLAGGISAGRHADHCRAVRHPRFIGIDVDTAARGQDGRICGLRVETLRRSWMTPPEGGGRHAIELY
jgi:phosphoribosylanthranilate isomerase